jgi:hypothetical protein
LLASLVSAFSGAAVGCVALTLVYGLIVGEGPHAAPIGFIMGAVVGIPAGALAGLAVTLRSTFRSSTTVDEEPSPPSIDVIIKVLYCIAIVIALGPLIAVLVMSPGR